jgi:hypothetical protein
VLERIWDVLDVASTGKHDLRCHLFKLGVYTSACAAQCYNAFSWLYGHGVHLCSIARLPAEEDALREPLWKWADAVRLSLPLPGAPLRPTMSTAAVEYYITIMIVNMRRHACNAAIQAEAKRARICDVAI